MRKLAVAGILLASCTLAAAQESPPADKSSSSGNWFTHMFGLGGQEEPKKPVEKKKEPAAAPSPAAIRAREEVILNRRLEVILKLRTIAMTTNDSELQRLVDELEERANAIYQERTAGLAFASPARHTDRTASSRLQSPGSAAASAGAGGDDR
jgi:hypothetical protein